MQPLTSRYKPQTDSVVQDLMYKNVTTKVDTPTKWISPAFFVPKPDGIQMRLVTDYTKLNKFVHRPIHPFPSPCSPYHTGKSCSQN